MSAAVQRHHMRGWNGMFKSRSMSHGLSGIETICVREGKEVLLRLLMDHGRVAVTGSGHRTCRRRPMVDGTVRGRRILCEANDCMIHCSGQDQALEGTKQGTNLPLNHEMATILHRIADTSGPIAWVVTITIGNRSREIRIRHGRGRRRYMPRVNIQFSTESGR